MKRAFRAQALNKLLTVSSPMHGLHGARSLLPACMAQAPAHAHLAHRQTVPADDVGRVYLVAHQLVGALEQLGSQDHYRCGAIAHLRVLQLCKLHEDLCVQVDGLQQSRKGCAGGSERLRTAYLSCKLMALP